MQLFANAVIALDLGYSVGFKKKSLLRKKIVEEGGIISYIVTKKCKYVVTSDPEKCDVSSKCRMATKYNLPVLSLDFIWDSLDAGKVQPIASYIVGGKSKILDFKSGKIASSKLKDENKSSKKSFRFNPRNVKIWTDHDVNLPDFDEEGHVVAKYAFYTKMNTDDLDVIEVHAPPLPHERLVLEEKEDLKESFEFKYRITLQHGPKARLEEGHICSKDIRYTKTAEQALAVYAMLCEDFNKKAEYIQMEAPVRNVGSHNLQKLIAKDSFTDGNVNETVQDLVEHVWREAMTELSDCLGDVKKIKTDQLEKAEAILSKIRESLKAAASDSEISTLVDSFYDALPHEVKEAHPNAKNCKQWLMKKQDMCQLIKDVISVNEITNFEMRSVIDAKYEALRCEICHLESKDNRRRSVEEKVISAIGDPQCHITITNVFEVWRQVEDITFRHDLDNKRLLFHSSKVENYVGILSRGLLLPKVIVDEYGGKRSDIGLLGGGIYFASDPSTSIKYSTASRTKGTRLLLINEVALGKCQDFSAHCTDLVAAPEGFDSTHGVSKKWDPSSAFEDDEYVVYNVNQQRLRYLVEFKLEDDTVKPIDDMEEGLELLSWNDHSQITIYDVKGVADPLSKVKSGLIGKGDQQVDLKGVHIRAKLIDLAAQVVVLQEYYNGSDESIEAKYVFPLDDAAAVCGFEAFINGKHIVGEVKEKESAHKEYKQAIKEGHGAYLMDQDEEAPDVFTVSVGNLPAKACVLIKITYVAELQVEGELINFRLPASVAPWKEDAALKKHTQDDLSSHKVVGDQTSVQVSIEMPFEIRSLTCPTHNVKIKQTASKAYVEMFEGQEYGSGFQLLIGLAEIHVPRMWVERHPEDPNHRACMLTFYPEFEANENEAEIIIFVDCSNSMKGSASVDAKKVALLLLNHLPSGSLFNVVRFGSVWEELFPASYAMSNENWRKAWEFVMNSHPEKGNTNVIQPLHSIFLMPNSQFMRNVFLISDGHINDDEVILKSAFLNHDSVRIFTFGVSSTCNSFCLKAIARVSGGAFEFFNQATKSKWEPKVKDQISKARQPGLTSVSVKWEQHDDNLPPPTQAPKQITALYNGSRQVVYGFVPNCTMATLSASVGGQELSTLVSTSELGITDGMVVHRLSARAIIRDWEDGVLSQDRTGHEVAKMDMKNFVIDLSKQYSIVTQLTSFIAVEKRDENEKDVDNKGPTMEELVQRENVDILDYMGWTHEPAIEDLPTGYLISMLTKSVNERYLPEKFSEKLAIMEEKCRYYLKDLELCSTDAFDVATTMMTAFDLKGEPQKAAEFGAKCYEESINRLDEISEDKRDNVISRLWSFKKKIDKLDGDVTLSPLPETAAQSVNIVTLTGKTISVGIEDTMTVHDLQKKISDKEGIPPDFQRFIYKGKQLESSRNLKDYEIRPDDSIHMVLRLRGGPAPDEVLESTHRRCGLMASDSDGSSDESNMDSIDEWCSETDNVPVLMSAPVPREEPERRLKRESAPAPSTYFDDESGSECEIGPFDTLSVLGDFPEESERSLEQKVAWAPMTYIGAAESEMGFGLFDSSSVGDMEESWLADEKAKPVPLFDQGLELESVAPIDYDLLPCSATDDVYESLDVSANAFESEEPMILSPADRDDDLGMLLDFLAPTAKALKSTAGKSVGGSSSERKKAANEDVIDREEETYALCLVEDGEAKRIGGYGRTGGMGAINTASLSKVKSYEEKAHSPRPFETSEARMSGTGFTFGGSSEAYGGGGGSGFGSYQTTAVPFGGMSMIATASSALLDSSYRSRSEHFPDDSGFAPQPEPLSGAAPQGFGFGSPAKPPVPRPLSCSAAPPGFASFGSPAKPPVPPPPPPSAPAAAGFAAFGSPAKPPVPPPPPPSALAAAGFAAFGSPAKLSAPPPPPQPAPAAPGFAAFGSPAKSDFQQSQPAIKASALFGSPLKASAPPPPPPPSTFYSSIPVEPSGSPMPPFASESYANVPSRKKHGDGVVMLSQKKNLLKGATKRFDEKEKTDALPPPLPSRGGPPEAKGYYATAAPPKSAEKRFNEKEKSDALPPPLSPRSEARILIQRYSNAVPSFQSMAHSKGAPHESLNKKKEKAPVPAADSDSFIDFSKKCKSHKKSNKMVAKKILTYTKVLGEDISSVYLSDTHQRCYTEKFEVKESEKPVEQESSLSLAQFGIGTELGLVRQARYRLKVSDIAAILELQNYNGSWEFSAKIDSLIGINSETCLSILKRSGLYSLGKITAHEVEMLVATLLVLVALSELLFPHSFPLDVNELRLAKIRPGEFDQDTMKKELTSAGLSIDEVENLIAKMLLASDFCYEIDQRHPLVYSTLELGPNWPFVAATLMNVIKEDSI